jgi:hypothetical protein
MKVVTTILFMCFALSAAAEDYKAPKVQLKSKTPKKTVEVKKGEWESGLSYKVEEDPEADRNIASDQEDVNGRDPSSIENPIPKVERWDFEDIENSPVE